MSVSRLTPDDELMLRASAVWPQDIDAFIPLDGAGLFDQDGSFHIERVREAVGRRLHLVPRFRQVIDVPSFGRGGPFWTDDRDFDLSRHVRERVLEAADGDEGVLAIVEMLRREPFDASHPLWAMWLLTEVPERRVFLFVRIHHAIADGLAAMRMVASLLDDTPDAPVEAPVVWAPRRPPKGSELVGDELRRRLRAIQRVMTAVEQPRSIVRGVLDTWPALRELILEQPGPSTSLNQIAGAGRRHATVTTSYSSVRRVARAHGATSNDVLLAVTAAGLRGLLIHRREKVEATSIPVYVPIALRRGLHERSEGTEIGQMIVRLPLRPSPDPDERLRMLAAETAARKAVPRRPIRAPMPGRVGTRLMLLAAMRGRVNVTTASIPGPAHPRYLAGARVLEVFPLLPLVANVPLAIGAVSYAGSWDVGITVDRSAIPDLGVFVAGVRDELDRLGITNEQAAGAPAGRPVGDAGRAVG